MSLAASCIQNLLALNKHILPAMEHLIQYINQHDASMHVKATVETGCMETVMRAMDKNRYNVHIQAHGYTIISNLLSASCEDNPNVTFMAVQELKVLLNRRQEDYFVHVKSTLVHSGIIKAIMGTMMKNHEIQPTIQTCGSTILFDLFSYTSNPEEIAFMMQELIDLFSGPDEESAMHAKATIVVKLAGTTGGRSILEAIISAMTEHVIHVTVQTNGCAILFHLAETLTEYHKIIVDAGGLEALVKATTVHLGSSNSEVRDAAAQCARAIL